jgi:hypothetical protein
MSLSLSDANRPPWTNGQYPPWKGAIGSPPGVCRALSGSLPRLLQGPRHGGGRPASCFEPAAIINPEKGTRPGEPVHYPEFPFTQKKWELVKGNRFTIRSSAGVDKVCLWALECAVPWFLSVIPAEAGIQVCRHCERGEAIPALSFTRAQRPKGRPRPRRPCQRLSPRPRLVDLQTLNPYNVFWMLNLPF